MRTFTSRASIAAIFLALFAWLAFGQSAKAETAAELQRKIEERNQTLKQLEEEIKRDQAELSKTAAETKTLQSAVQSLDSNSRKLGTDIRITETKIDSTNLSIQQLGLDINDKEAKIKRNQEVIRRSIRLINEADTKNMLEILLTYPDVTTFWQQVETLEQLNASVKDNIDELKGLKETLVANKVKTEQKKDELLGLKSQLSEQRIGVELNKQAKSELLSVTKSKEANYRQLVAEKEAKHKAFERELEQYEAQLKLFTDPSSIPSPKKGILAWPLDSVRISQYFGNTQFAKSGAYNGSGHNGIDLAAPIGTPIKAALSGEVIGSGDTDTTCPNASYGKWVLVRHSNGLSSLYAHLSRIIATNGSQVETGDVLGYSGNTGYSTGPHLHFTVYASQGVQIMSRPSKACGGATYTMPVADLRAYLNPMDYL